VAVFRFKALSDGQAIGFDPSVEVLNSSQAIDVTGAAGTFKF